MGKLDSYSRIVEKKQELFQDCTRACGPWKLMPTNKGGIIFQYNDKDVKTDMPPKELKELRDLISCFLNEVVE